MQHGRMLDNYHGSDLIIIITFGTENDISRWAQNKFLTGGGGRWRETHPKKTPPANPMWCRATQPFPWRRVSSFTVRPPTQGPASPPKSNPALASDVSLGAPGPARPTPPHIIIIIIISCPHLLLAD